MATYLDGMDGGKHNSDETEASFTPKKKKNALTKYLKIEKAKKLLRDNGYFTDNLWQVDDVKEKFECTDEQAQDILHKSLTNEATMQQIWFSIDEFGNMEGLTPKQNEE